VQSIVEGISQIVNGNIAPAANRVEQTLASLLPVAISFLANLLGIGGIANRVRQIIDQVRDRIENAIVTFIQRIASRFTGRGRGAAGTSAETSAAEPAAESGDIQDRAKVLISQQLRSGHDEAETQTILNQTLNQLRPDGLRAIVLGPEAADGTREIFTEASPRRRAVRLVPQRSRGRVRMFVTLRLSGTEPAFPEFPNVSGTERPVTHLRRNESGELEDVTDTSALRFVPVGGVTAAPRRGASRRQQGQRFRSGGVVFRPDEATPNEVRTASWSTGEDSDSRSNLTHAEHQFFEWFKTQNQDFRQRVENIEVRIEKSPCKLCVSDLAALLSRWAPSASVAVLDYEETYLTLPNATTQRSLGQLRGWRITGPQRGEPPPSGDEHNFVLDDR